jgi:hypothetical protein
VVPSGQRPCCGFPRLLRLTHGLNTTIAAEKVIALAERARAERYVRKFPTDNTAVAYIAARVATADAIFFDAQIDRIADILSAHGDVDTKEARRAKAVGVLATPARARLLLAEAAGPSCFRHAEGTADRFGADVPSAGSGTPTRIRNQVLLRDRVEVFPFSSQEARTQDLDHTEVFVAGGPSLPGRAERQRPPRHRPAPSRLRRGAVAP